MGDIYTFITNINKNYMYQFVNRNFNKYVDTVIKNMFKNLNTRDANILIRLTVLIIDIISYRNNFTNIAIYFNQWKENNNRDIKGVVYLLLPFIDDTKIIKGVPILDLIFDLNQLLDSNRFTDTITTNIFNIEKEKILETKNPLTYGNFSLGLIKNKNLTLKVEDIKLIYDIMYHNIIGLLETLEIINGKYYINWINIIPLNLNNYLTSKIYIKTVNLLSRFSNPNGVNYYILNNNILLLSPGIWVGDIYNIIRINLYEECKKFKWLIFPYETIDNKSYLIHKLHEIIDIEYILNNDIYDNNHITNKINNIINLLKDTSNPSKNTIDSIKYLLLYTINNTILNNNNTPAITKFKILSDTDEETRDDFTEKITIDINKITKYNIIDCLEYIINSNSINILWDYLKKILNEFILSIYGKYLFIKENNLYKLLNVYNYNNNDINLKNIYNIAKALSHDSINNWKLLDKNYISLSYENRCNFFNKLYNHVPADTWININKNLIKQYNYLTPFVYADKLINLLDIFKSIYITLIFEYLIYNGLLSDYKLFNNITDNELLSSNTDIKKIEIKKLLKKNFDDNMLEWNEAYYYLTNDKYGNLPIITKNNKNYSYFDFIVFEQAWMMFYSLNQISQISFFKHYIFHQIMFITGATGQGKSTQVPKLLLYSLKFIDYRTNGKVLCTAPRINPLINNSERISEELGTPLKNNDIENFYVQYKYKGTNHEKIINKGFIKIITDGLLITEISDNITLFSINNGKNGKKEKKEKIYNNNPVYDVLFIDEVHEHNTNIDLILTLARQTCYMNNKIRLMIVSATMEEDELIYRNFYNPINDKLLYPIKYLSLDPILPRRFELNLRYLDRRYHISPPGETLQYTVKEYYIDNNKYYISSELSDGEKSKIALELCYDKAVELCNKDMKGHILLFSTGYAEIKILVEKLNKNIPDNCIALPYYSQLHENYKNIVSKINTKISDIKNNKEDIHIEWGSNYIEKTNDRNNNYKYAIFVATNIAEASITIPLLYYVLDNGYVKVNSFIPTNTRLKTTLIISQISESSRLQRKGRVGRTNNGEIYYMYGKDRSTNVVNVKYNITNDNIFTTLLYMLASKNKDDIYIDDINNNDRLLISDIYNPNIYNGLNNTVKDTLIEKSNLLNIYKANYITHESPNYIKYYFSDKLDNSFKVFDTGQILENILDYNGKFYIIHPFEKKIFRNILSEIISFNNIKSINIPLSEYKDFFLYLNNSYGLISISNKYLLNDYNNINCHKFMVKTKIFDISYNIYTELELPNIQYGISMIAAIAMNCHVDVYNIILLLVLISFDIKNIKSTDISVTKFIKLYKYHKSDIIFIYDIIKELKYSFNKLFNKLEVSLYNNIITNIDDDINNYTEDIKKWALSRKLNDYIIISFIRKLPEEYRKLFKKCEQHIAESKKYSINFIKHLTTFDIEEKIIRSFIYGNQLQYIIKSNEYMANNLIISNEINEYNNIITLVDKSNDLLFYLHYDILMDTNKIEIKILSYVDIKWLVAASQYTIEYIFEDYCNNKKHDYYLSNIRNSKNDRYNLFDTKDDNILKLYYKL